MLFPKHRTDLLGCAVTVRRMLDGDIETLQVPANPLDILAQHTVAACALESMDVEKWFDVVRRSAPSPPYRAAHLMRFSTYSAASTPLPISPSYDRASYTTETKEHSPDGPARNGWQSPPEVRYPIAVCSRYICMRAPRARSLRG